MNQSPCTWREPITIFKLLGLIFVFAIIMVALFRDVFVNKPYWQINVAGRGEIEYTADQANIVLGVQVDKARTAAAALATLNESMGEAIDAVKALGIPEEKIRTENYNLYTQYDYVDGISRVGGYNANQSLRVTVDGIKENRDKVSQVIAAAAKAGVNQINQVSFEPENIEELREEARMLAIKDAREKADDMADALGVKLGKLVGWWENLYPAEQAYYNDMAYGKGGGGMPNLPAGQDKITVEINLNYLIK